MTSAAGRSAPLHALAGLVAAGLQDALEAGVTAIEADFLRLIEGRFAVLSSSEAEAAARDVFRVLSVLRQHASDFEVQPIKEALFRAARRIAARDGRLVGASDAARRAQRATCGQQEVKAAPKVPAPVVGSKDASSRPRLTEQLEKLDEARAAKLAALADGLLASCAPKSKPQRASEQREAKVL